MPVRTCSPRAFTYATSDLLLVSLRCMCGCVRQYICRSAYVVFILALLYTWLYSQDGTSRFSVQKGGKTIEILHFMVIRITIDLHACALAVFFVSIATSWTCRVVNISTHLHTTTHS